MKISSSGPPPTKKFASDVSVYNPFLDAFISALNERFVNRRKLFGSFTCLPPPMPEQLGKTHAIAELYNFYTSDPLLSDLSTLQGELKIFHQRLSRLPSLRRNAVDASTVCDKVIYPNENRLLQLLSTLPVSSATNERSFSTLKRIKTYLRNSLGEAILNGLAMLSIHCKIDVDVKLLLTLQNLATVACDLFCKSELGLLNAKQ